MDGENREPLVSVIVPIYNGEKFLYECIDSVFVQSYKNWELLLINDGSKDKSLDICHSYALKDTRIKSFYKSNTGVSDSRNYGLEKSSGDFIIFLDADDFWHDRFILSKMVSLLVGHHADICCGDYRYVDESGSTFVGKPIEINKNLYGSNFIEYVDFFKTILDGDFFLWRCLIRRKAIGNLRFNSKRIFLEDAEFYLRLFQCESLKCMYLPICFYSYRKHEDSVTVKDIPGEKKLRDAFDFTRLCLSLSVESADAKMKDFLKKKGIDNYLFDIFIIGKSKKTYKNRNFLFSEWNISALQNEVKKVVMDNNWHLKYKIALFPLELQLKYFRYKHYTKLFIKKILNKILK